MNSFNRKKEFHGKSLGSGLKLLALAITNCVTLGNLPL